jgi:hypothetical protein
MHVSETSCLVKLFGPIHCWSFCDAFAERVMIALIKSPAEVWVHVGYSLPRYVSSSGIRFCDWSHCVSVRKLHTVVLTELTSTMPCPPSAFSILIIFNKRSITGAQSIC